MRDGCCATVTDICPNTAKQAGAGALLGHIQGVARVAMTGRGVPVSITVIDFTEVLVASAISGDKAPPMAGIALWQLARAKPQLLVKPHKTRGGTGVAAEP